MKKALALATLCAVILVAFAAPSFAQQYPPPRPPTCNAQDHTPEPGQTVLFGGKFWKPNTQITAGFHQKRTDATVIVTTNTGPDDQWFVSITVPENVINGPAVFGAIGKDKRGNPFRCIVPVRIVGAGTPQPTAATTERGVTTGMASLAALVLFGGYLVVRHRRRVKSLVA